MSYKICQVIFSTNRIEYLTRTLAAQNHLDFSGCIVDKIFIDDFPKDRNDNMISFLARSFGYKELYLHSENKGLSVTWTEFWNLIKNRNYDFIWHQEDDVEILEPVKILDLIDILNSDSELCQVVLKRQPWYFHETESEPLDTDIIKNQYRLEKGSVTFSPMASLYSINAVRFDYSKFFEDNFPGTNYNKINFNEGMIGLALYRKLGLVSANVKNSQGKNIISHIGEYFVGKRVLEDEPHYEKFAMFDPEKKYNSRNGSEYT